jgi:hypothetical protein
MNHSWTCRCCEQQFNTLPTSYGAIAPLNWFALPKDQRAARAKLDSDICIIDNREWYVRGCLEVPIVGSSEPFVWGIWVSVSEESLRYILDKWQAEIGPEEPPRFGWLCSWIPGYPEPRDIKCHVFLRSGDLYPRIVLEPTDYPLAIEQRHGITVERIEQIAAANSAH